MRRINLLLVMIFCLCVVTPAYPYWIWTPKTGKWINPKTAVRPSPKAETFGRVALPLLVSARFQVLFHSVAHGSFHLSLTVLVHYRSPGSI